MKSGDEADVINDFPFFRLSHTQTYTTNSQILCNDEIDENSSSTKARDELIEFFFAGGWLHIYYPMAAKTSRLL